MDKIDMSLDDIIKQQKKEKAKQAKKKAVQVTKQYRRGGNKINQPGVSPLNRTTIKPSSIVDGKKAYSARYIKPFLPNKGWKKQGRGGNRNNQVNNKVNGQLKQKANQRQRQFNQRRGLNTQAYTTKVKNQTKRVPAQGAVRGRGRGRGNRGRGRQVNNAGRVLQTNSAGRGRPTNNAVRGRQTTNRGRGRQAVSKGRLQQPVKTVKTTNIRPAMLKVSIKNTADAGISNAPVKLKRNTFISRKPSTLNERFSNFQGGNKQKQKQSNSTTQRTVLF